jgi:hypothetical protein
MHAELGAHPSKVWRSIMEGQVVLATGIIRCIGTGEETDAWNDNWILRDGALRPIHCKTTNPPHRVSNFIDYSTWQWDVQKLNAHFIPMDVQRIQSIPISTRRQADIWAWHYDKCGIVSVRSTYRMVASLRESREAWLDETTSCSDHDRVHKSWSKLWHVQVPSKVRMFLWRLTKQSLPIADSLHHRHISPTSRCGLCGAEDSWKHSLIDCTMARCVWSLSHAETLEHMCMV